MTELALGRAEANAGVDFLHQPCKKSEWLSRVVMKVDDVPYWPPSCSAGPYPQVKIVKKKSCAPRWRGAI
jgi:hypothetical protein